MARRTSVIQVMVTGDATDLNRATQSGSKGMGLLGASALAASKIVASSLTAIAGFSIREFAKFNDSMVKSTAIMGDLSDVMRTDMEQAARDVAKTTSFAASEAADAFFFLASAGLDAEASIAALPQVAQFAQAGAFDLARATDLLTDAQSALGLTSDDTAENLEQLTRVSDVLVKANTLANASVDQFSEALTERAGAAMRALGVEIETGVAVLGVFADQGIKGSKAGTMLNTTLEGLTRTAREQSEAYDRLGVSVFDSEGNMRGMADIVGELEGALDGMSTEARLAELSTLGLTRQARDGVIQLLGNADAIREYEDALRDAGGTTQDVADRQLESFNAQLGLLMSGFADIGITIGEALAGPLGRFVAWFQEQLPAIEGFVNRAVPAFERFVASAGEKFTEFKRFFDENLREPLGALLTTLREIGGFALDKVFEFTGAAKEFLVDFAVAVGEGDFDRAGRILGETITNLLDLAISTGGDLSKAIGEWFGRQDWEAIGKSAAKHTGTFAKGLFSGLFTSIDEETGEQEFDWSKFMRLLAAGLVLRIPVFRRALAARTGLFRISIFRWLSNIVLALTAGLGPLLRTLWAAFATRLGTAFAGSNIGRVFSAIGLALQRLANGQIGLMLTGLVQALGGLFSSLTVKLGEFFIRMWPVIRPALQRIGLRIALWFTGPGVKLLIGAVAGFAKALAAAIGGIPALVIGAIVAAVAAIGFAFVTTFHEWRDQSEEEFSNIGSEIVAFIVHGQQIREDWFDRTVTQWFRDRWASITKWIATQRETFQNWGISIIDGVISGLQSRGDAISNWMGDELEKAWNRVKSFLKIGSPSKLFAEAGRAIGDGLTLGIDDSSVGVLRSLSGLSADLAGTDFRAPQVPVGRTAAPSIVVNVSGAIDPEGTARQIERILRDSQRRTGGVFV